MRAIGRARGYELYSLRSAMTSRVDGSTRIGASFCAGHGHRVLSEARAWSGERSHEPEARASSSYVSGRMHVLSASMPCWLSWIWYP